MALLREKLNRDVGAGTEATIIAHEMIAAADNGRSETERIAELDPVFRS